MPRRHVAYHPFAATSCFPSKRLSQAFHSYLLASLLNGRAPAPAWHQPGRHVPFGGKANRSKANLIWNPNLALLTLLMAYDLLGQSLK